MAEDWEAGGFGLYLHWPFCQSKCPYCDFNSHVVAEIDQSRWEHAYLSEIDRVAAETRGRTLHTVFFGGGTPSLMDPNLVAAILERVRTSWPQANQVEITLEANPSSVEASRFAGYRDAGVNRISMGIQSLNDTDLRALGRLHSVAEARQAFDIARSTFDRISFDLIYARQNQSLDDWRLELNDALGMAVDHLSLYQLTIENGTAFGDRYARGGLKGLPEDDLAADMYALTQEVCAKADFSAYEVSNHARPGDESKHNLIYWRYGDYAGIGPGAHGRLTIGERYAIDTPLQPGAWLKQVETTGSGEANRTPLSRIDQAAEYLMMGLRISEGINIDRYERLAGKKIDPKKISYLEELGLVCQTETQLHATQKGRMILNAVIRDLLE